MCRRLPRSTAITCCTGWPRSRKCRRTPPRSPGGAAIVKRALPYLVAERDGRLIGYCYAGPFRPRVAYRFTVEDSVYVEAGEIGRGLGRALLEQVIARCGELG